MSSKLRQAVSRLVREIEDGMLVEVSSKFECDLAKTLLVDVKSALAEPLRNCDRFKSEYDYDKLHEAFVKHCDSCNCPMGCIHRRDTGCMLDTRCGSILKCFAKFVLAEAKGETK